MILQRRTFVIMDKTRKFIVQHGADKYKTKYITNVNEADTDSKLTLRVFFYDTIGRAKSGLNSYFMDIEKMLEFYPEISESQEFKNIPHYRKDKYDKYIQSKLSEMLEVVEVNMSISEL